MIEIDDAGSGSLIGGTGIGIMRTETKEYIFRLIPLEYFQLPHFPAKIYQKYVIDIVANSFQELKVKDNEPIKVCRGYIFDELRRWLTHEGFVWESTKIEGALQDLVEDSFFRYVVGLGLPLNFVQHARYAFGFHRLLKWVFADFETRSCLCKTGWKSWNKWCNTKRTFNRGRAKRKGYCLKCGGVIQKNEPVFTLEYYTTKLWTIDLHTSCVERNY